jgi:hypothetical protein
MCPKASVSEQSSVHAPLGVLVTATRPTRAGVIGSRKDGKHHDNTVTTLLAPQPQILELTPAAAPQAMPEPEPEPEPVARVDSGC